ncbi:MAG TPA: hypothetical protein VFA33_22135 [Bryobacteraceae bacterium]|nr:hypothetical protein [Bryobacteraceae bacterium]
MATAEDSFAVRLRDTLHPEDYVLIRACSRAEILEAVERAGTSVVILDHDLREVDWRGLVTVLGEAQCSPALVLASRLANERLWAEVLNLGAFDLIPWPFEEGEVVRVVDAAVRESRRNARAHWHRTAPEFSARASA